ncbi:hypothetical protein D4S03_02025 [bacterium]|nr:MAG: hypothetical protein D4S03_02025 [bacterium]
MLRCLLVEYHEISPNFTSDFLGLVSHSNNIAITAHKDPDEDSIASVLSIFEIISKKYPGKNLKIIYSSDPDPKYKVFKNYDKIEFVKDLANHLENTDLLIMLDGSNYSRFSNKEERLKSISNTICIDHHCSPIDKFTLSLVAPQYPACAEIIFRSLFNDFKIDKPLAEIFLMGILGDTGNFTYLKPNQSETLALAQKLLEISQVEIQEFQSRYRTISKREFAIIQELIKNTRYSSVNNWPDFQYSFIERSYTKNNNFTDIETSEASYLYSTEYIRTIEGNVWGFVVAPKNNGDIYISCRSLPGSVNVRDLMERMGIGGGHHRASGGTFAKTDQPLDVVPCIERILNWLKANSPVLG